MSFARYKRGKSCRVKGYKKDMSLMNLLKYQELLHIGSVRDDDLLALL